MTDRQQNRNAQGGGDKDAGKYGDSAAQHAKEADDKRQNDPREGLGEDEASYLGWKRFEQYVPDVVKRGIVSGIGAIVMGEDGQRAGLGDLKLPKEVVSHLVAQIEKSKRDITLVLARELRSFLDDVDITGVLQKALEGMTIDLHTQVRFLPSDAEGKHKLQMDPVESSMHFEKKNNKKSPKAKPQSKQKNKAKPKTKSPESSAKATVDQAVKKNVDDVKS